MVIGTSTSGKIDIDHRNLEVYTLDLSRAESIRECVAEITTQGKSLDILINNAGVALDLDLHVVDIEKLRKTLEVNLIGTIDFTEQIIHTAESDDSEFPAYRISKTALNMYTRTLSIRLAGKALVSSFHPGWVQTDMGGVGAPVTPEEAAEYIYKLAVSKVETGQLWFKGEKLAW
jgi:NAD(P)-dependent dehydrogenase (short-subunit alcohol dehydrogenase family)